MGKVELTDDQIKEIVEKVADEVFNRIYAEVGRSVLKKLSWLAGIGITGLTVYLASKGIIKV